ncbi:MAG: HDOD domain-containing protein [Oscillospiraceae bacterium]|nr:HDOD domain-containing protein [Oscillospiraceae bacterium]
MKFFISSIPFFDAKMAVHAYRMMARDGSKLIGSDEYYRMQSAAMQSPALDTVEQIGVEPFAGDNDLFIDIEEYQLLMGMPLGANLPPEKLVCTVQHAIVNDDAIRAKLDILLENGYRLAVEGLPKSPDIETVCEIFDYILLAFNTESFASDLKQLRDHLSQIKLIITNIPDKKSFDMFAGMSDILLTGDFYKEPITEGKVEISPIKINALHLIKQINDENFDLSSAAKTIEHDPALSISLLRFINSINPNRSKKIESIRGAVAILGQKEVKKWATVAISVGIGEDRPSEITRLSLIRAKFAENLAPAFEMAIKSGSLFIAGLFSLLDVILQLPMSRAIDEVAVVDEVREALITNTGRIAEVLGLIRLYERADWYSASISMVRNGVNADVVTNAFIDALQWYKQLLKSIDSEGEGDEPEPTP